MKLLLWIAVGVLVYVWLARGKTSSPAAGAARDGTAAGPRQIGTEAMVQCVYCKVHVPVSESVAGSSGAVFCSEDHRRLGDVRA